MQQTLRWYTNLQWPSEVQERHCRVEAEVMCKMLECIVLAMYQDVTGAMY